MVRHRMRLLRVGFLVADGLAAMALFTLVSIARFGDGWRAVWADVGAPWWAWAAAYGILWLAVEWLQELDRVRARWTMRGEITAVLRASLVLAVVLFSLLFLVHAPQVSRLFLVMLLVSQVVFAVVQRRAIRFLLIVARRRGIGGRNILVLDTGSAARSVADRLARHPALGYRIVGFMGTPTDTCPVVVGPLDAIETFMHESVVDEVVAALEPEDGRYLEAVIALCEQEGKRLRIVLFPGMTELVGGRAETLGEHEIVTVTNGPDRLVGLAAKRAIDLAVATVALAILSPILLLAALAVWLEDRGPVLFRQPRVGLHGRPFMIVKFRTMVPDAEARLAEVLALNEISGHAFKVGADPRVTRVGRWMRRTSLDELPQFWNVVRGQMSVVGPRPPLPGEVAAYDLWHRRRLSMKPGITGLWQVSARLEAEFDRWVELDLAYIDSWSLWLDFKIMLRTLPAMLSGR